MLSIRCKMLLENFANIILISRENWLSPLIRATWEARTVRWREVEGLRLGTVHRGGQARDERRPGGYLLLHGQTGCEFESQPKSRQQQPDPVLINVLCCTYYKMKKNKSKNIKKHFTTNLFSKFTRSNNFRNKLNFVIFSDC